MSTQINSSKQIDLTNNFTRKDRIYSLDIYKVFWDFFFNGKNEAANKWTDVDNLIEFEYSIFTVNIMFEGSQVTLRTS